MKTHMNGGGQVADTATVSEDSYVGADCKILDNAVLQNGAIVANGSVVSGNAIVDSAEVTDGAVVGGVTHLQYCNVHGHVTLLKTPIVLRGFEQEIVIADDFVIIGCQTISIEDWKTRSVALLRANGYPKASAERLRDSIDVIRDCYKSLYHEDDLKKAFKFA
jgi:NDP-sugar pyrophosphorylase family protein